MWLKFFFIKPSSRFSVFFVLCLLHSSNAMYLEEIFISSISSLHLSHWFYLDLMPLICDYLWIPGEYSHVPSLLVTPVNFANTSFSTFWSCFLKTKKQHTSRKGNSNKWDIKIFKISVIYLKYKIYQINIWPHSNLKSLWKWRHNW